METLTTPHRVIRASAGAGKTFQLTGHYLRLLRAGAEPSQILATTFTRKAAGEIQGKILTRLVQASENANQRQDLAHHTGGGTLTQADCLLMLRQMVGAMHRLAIATIDGFFHRITTSFRYELDLPLQPQLVDAGSPTARALRQDAIRAMLADTDWTELLRLLRQLHHDQAAQSVTAALDQLVVELHETYRQAPEAASWQQLTGPEPLDQASFDQAFEQMQQADALLPTRKKDDAPDQRWQKALGDNVHDAWVGDWERFLSRGLAPKIAEGQTTFYSTEISPALVAAYQPIIEHARGRLLEVLRQQNLARFTLLHYFDAHYQALRRQHNVLLFSDLTDALARRMPALDEGQLAEIYFRLDSRVWHLLLDEFQDTSLDQWTVLRPFAEEIAAHGEPDPVMGARSFFCVGDTKQAIYGWRGGCAALLDELGAQLHLPQASFESLSTSFRSVPAVLDSVNAVFETIGQNTILTDESPHAADGEAAGDFETAFSPHQAAEHLQNTPGYVALETSPQSMNHNEDAASAETAETEAPLSDHEQYVTERIRACYAQAPHATMGVLVRTNAMAGRLMHALKQTGPGGEAALPVSGEGGAPLTDTPAVNAMLSALILADHPGPPRGQSAAAFHVMHSPLNEALQLTSAEPRHVQHLAWQIRRALLSDGYARVIARWVSQVAQACDARSLGRLEQLIELAEAYEPELTLRPGRFVEYVQRTPVEQVSPAPVRVMTIHRAKGLEFDQVVLPELDRLLTDDFQLLIDRDGPTGSIQAIHPCPKKALRQLSASLTDAHHAQRRQRRYEDLCGLYVAMTRAQRALHMIVRPPQRTKTGALRKPALSYAEVLREALSTVPREQEAGSCRLFETGQRDWPPAEATSSPPSATTPGEAGEEATQVLDQPKPRREAQQPRRAWHAVSPSTLMQQSTVQAQELLQMPTAGQARGALLHQFFEQVGFLDDEGALPTRQTLEALAQQAGQADDELESVIDQFYTMLQAPAIDRLLRRPSPEADLWRERAFAVRDHGSLLEGRFDRVHVTADDAAAPPVHLIDFKTDRVDSDPAMHQAAEAYQPQLAAYRRALALMLKTDETRLTATLAFVHYGACVTLEPAPDRAS
jgi:ATP-dependent exoDNAse (exonuclease V) beta subunit